MLGVGVVTALAVAVGVALVASRSRPAVASPFSSPSVVAASQAGASTPPAAEPLASALIATLGAGSFAAHVDESIVARSSANGRTVTITAKAMGDVSGRDVSIHATGTGAGPAVDQEIITVGDRAWVRSASSASWVEHPRSDVSSSVDGLLQTIRLIDDPRQLSDAGVETVDGRSLHHLTALGTVVYRSPDGAEGTYDSFDVWVTDRGVPVLAKASFSASQGGNAIVGNVDVRYDLVGGPITIRPPAGTPAPSR